MASLKETTAPQFKATSAASHAQHLIRKTEHDAAIAVRAPVVHAHAFTDVSGIAEGIQDTVGAMMTSSGTVTPTYDDPTGTIELNVRIKAGSNALRSDAGGMFVALGSGPGEAAEGNHTHPWEHAPLTVEDSDSMDLTLAGQLVRGDLRIRVGGGIKATSSGVEADIGTASTQVAAGNHTHAQLHDAATKEDSQSAAITLTGQQVRVDVRRDGAPSAGRGRIGVGGAGLYMVLGSGTDEAAAGDHVHGPASTTRDGCLTAADKQKLDGFSELMQVSQVVPYVRGSYAVRDEYVGGRYKWEQTMQVTGVNLVGRAATTSGTAELEVDGALTGDRIGIPTGAVNSEVVNDAGFSDLFVEAGKFARWLVVSGPTDPEQCASEVTLAMNVRPALGVVPVKRINAGGSASGVWANDQYYDSGTTASIVVSVDVSGVTDPAPQEVYRTWRYRDTAEGYPLKYAVTGLGRGVDYKVRCHFAEHLHASAGANHFHISVQGAEVLNHLDFDPWAQAGGAQYKAVVKEFTLKADANGTIRVHLVPLVGSGGVYRCGINGIEIVEA